GRSEPGEPQMLVLESSLEGVRAVNLGQILGELSGLAESFAGHEGGRSDGVQTGKVDLGQAAVETVLRNALNPEFRRDALLGRKGLKLAGGQPAVTEPQLIDGGRRKGVGLAQHRAHAVVVEGVLSEAAAVREALEGSRDEVRIVSVAQPPEQLVLLAEVVVDANVKLLGVVPHYRVGSVVVKETGPVRRRIQVEQRDGIGVEPRSWKLVAGKRVTDKTNGLAEGNVVARIALAGARRGQTCHWIGCSANDGTRGGGIKHAPEREGAAQKIVSCSTLAGDQLRKVRVAGRPLLGGGDGRHLGRGLPDASAFVIEEEKRFVLAIVDARYGHRAADRAAKLVLAEFAFGDAAGVLKEVGRVKLVIADELPQGAMNLVGTGLDRGIEHRPARASELGAEVARLNLELLDGIDWRLHGIGGAVQKVHGVIVVVDAV